MCRPLLTIRIDDFATAQLGYVAQQAVDDLFLGHALLPVATAILVGAVQERKTGPGQGLVEVKD